MPMLPPSPEVRARMAQYILNPQQVRDDLGERGSTLEDGRTVGGPRLASKKHAFNLKRAKGPKSKFDSYNTGGTIR